MNYKLHPREFKTLIGIDPGTATGYAIWDRVEKKLKVVETTKIHRLIKILLEMKGEFMVILEDATQVRFNTDPNKAQGAGSIKRDVAIWVDFFDDHGIRYKLVRPNKAMTKLKPELFTKITGYQGRTSSHGRDAAMLVFNL